MSDSAPLVTVTGLCCTFREGGQAQTILDGVTLSVARGEVVALLGRSGSGKSTLLNLISGLAPADAGRVDVAGHDLRGLSERARTLLRRRSIGFIYQFFNLIDTLSVSDKIMLPIELDQRPRAGDYDRAADMLAEAGLTERASSFPDRLSGGEILVDRDEEDHDRDDHRRRGGRQHPPFDGARADERVDEQRHRNGLEARQHEPEQQLYPREDETDNGH